MEQTQQSHFGVIMLVLIFLILAYAYIGNLLEHKHIHVIHQTGVGILIGFVFGLIIYFVHDMPDYQFNEEIFFYGLLPPMIFSGGYNLKKSTFFKNFSYISLYGALGTVMTFGIIFGLTYLINKLEWIREWGNIDNKIILTTGLIIKYSATICASDSVAALTMIKPDKYPKLFAIVFGQGMVNDAVAIILFKVVGDLFDHDITDGPVVIVFGLLLNFIVNILTSLLIGGACALLCTLIFKNSQFLTKNPMIQVTMLYLFGIMSYVIAQIFQFSGVITVLVCGIFLGHFNFYNLSTSGKVATGITFQTISFIAEAFVFIYLGISTMSYKQESFSYTFVLLELFICAFARFFTIFSLSYLVKSFKKKWNVSFYELLIITVAGIIRGSVAFALILTLDKKNSPDAKAISTIQSSVLLMVFITTLSLGAVMPSFITGCLKRDKTKQKQQIDPLIQSEDGESEKKIKQPSGMARFDQQFLKPMFIYEYKKRKGEIKEFKKLLKLNSPDYRGGEYTGIMRASVAENPHIQRTENLQSIFTDGK